MVIDTSALLAILLREPEAKAFAEAIARAGKRLVSALTALEAAIVIRGRKGPAGVRELDLLLHTGSLTIVNFDSEQVQLARAAYEKFGKGHHPAGLNLGDCCRLCAGGLCGRASPLQRQRLLSDRRAGCCLMKYGPIPENLFERLALLSGKAPVPLIDAIFSLMKARSLMAGVRLGVFTALVDGPRTAGEVAAARSLDGECTGLLLRMLTFAGYVKQKGDRFTLSALGRRSMVPGAPLELWGYLEWNYTQWDFVAHLEDLVRTGRGLDFHATMTDPGQWADYQRGMLEIARFDAPILAARVPVRRGARRLLDIAGSHGLLGAALCRKHPPMTSVVLDLPQAVETAREPRRRKGSARSSSTGQAISTAPTSAPGMTSCCSPTSSTTSSPKPTPASCSVLTTLWHPPAPWPSGKSNGQTAPPRPAPETARPSSSASPRRPRATAAANTPPGLRRQGLARSACSAPRCRRGACW